MSITVEPALLALLACPVCRRDQLDIADGQVSCPKCGWQAQLEGRVLSPAGTHEEASFDAKHDVLGDHNHHPVVWDLCYEHQCTAVTDALGAGQVLLDLGCGPSAPYAKPAGVRAIGIDPSLPSLESNTEVDMALHSSATSVPLTEASVDAVVGIYALHHMIGDSVAESWANVRSAMHEVARVAKPRAEVFVFEVCPWPPAWVAERVGWRAARRVLGSEVDFVFWPEKRLLELGNEVFPDAQVEQRRSKIKPLSMFPPVIGRPGLRIPWIAYPFHVVLLHWTLAGGDRPQAPARMLASTERAD